MSHPAPGRAHLPWLDLFRFAAALTVVAVHARGAAIAAFGTLPSEQKNLATAAFFALTRIGNEAVVAFFVLSGFLVGGIAIERMRQGSFDTASYAIDRIARIMLPLIPALALTALVAALQGNPIDLVVLAGNVVALQGIFVPEFGGNAPLWSLAYEMWFYVLVGAIGAAVSFNRRWLPLLIVLPAFAFAFTWLTPVYFVCWAVGAAAYLWRPRSRSAVAKSMAVVLIVYAIFCIQVEPASQSVSDATRRALGQWCVPVGLARILLAVGVAAIVQQLLLVPANGSWARRMDQAGSWGASFSYSLYLTHYPVIQLALLLGFEQATVLNAKAIAGWLLLIAASLAVAWVTYWLFESRTPALRRALKTRWMDARPAATSREGTAA